MKYNYFESVKDDVIDYLKSENINLTDENFDDVYDDLWIVDSVTGNASGSYTFNSYKAREYLNGNMDLLVEALQCFGYESLPFEMLDDPESMDVTIRCYLLNPALYEVLEEKES